MRNRMGFVRVVSGLLMLAFTGMACAHGGPNPLVCAAIGAAAGAGGGFAATHEHVEHDFDTYVTAGAATGGAILVGSAAYFICKAMEKEEAPPPPPPPPPMTHQPPPPPPPVAEKIVLRGVNFDFDKSNIRPDAAVILDEAARILGSGPGPAVSVEGNTDSIGTEQYNQGLSERRANSVKKYLVEHGVEESRLSTIGYGESRPIASNQTREGRALNRRVELNVQE
jgi:OOP family OmpA-OmpF porin